MSEDQYIEIIKTAAEIKLCVTNLEKMVDLSMKSHEKNSDRFFKIIIALIAMVGGIFGLKLNQPSGGIGVASVALGPTIDWAMTLSNFARYYTVFALLFTGGSILREYWRNGYNKYLGAGMIIMSFNITLQIFNLYQSLSINSLWFRLTYNTLFLIYAFNLGYKKE